MKINKCLCMFFFSCLTFQIASAQLAADLNGNYPVTESWSVTLYRGANDVATTITGKETGTLSISNGDYTQINHTGYANLNGLNTDQTIYTSYDGSTYEIDGAYPFSAEAGGSGGFYGIIQLTFFVVKVPLGSQADVPSVYPYDSSVFTTTGTSLTSLSGAGTMVDQNSGFGPVGPSYFINEADASSTASLTLPPPDTTPPTCQITDPTSGLQVGNSYYTIFGKASDNVAVADVFYQLNNNGWNVATTSNNWSNWAASVNLNPGMNTISAYAVDTSGNVSVTNSAKVVYVVSAPLTVGTNGLGTLSQNYNGALLQIGKSYSIKATPGTGFVFSNWTGGTSLPLAALTNGTTVQFLMQSNLMLQANFLDTAKPTLTVAAPTAGQRWTAASFTATGTAKDNWQVGEVQYQLNGGAWTNAMTANNWTNWTAALNLVPGTNVFAVYASDTTGNHSATTNNLNFQFVVTNQLQIHASGLGTISPNDSNAWLEVGRNYSIKATPASGFVVTNWTISTNWAGGRITNNATVQFMMASNLTLQVNFADVTMPKLVISSPTAGKRMTNALAYVVGTASDNWKVAGVWYQLNGNAWNLVTTTNGYTNWNQTVDLMAGTNILKVFAQDLGGNLSVTSSVSVYSTNAFKLQLAFSNAPVIAGGLAFSLLISPGMNGHIQVSTNLEDWATLTNFVGTNSTLNLQDATATNFNQRFYRAVVP